VGKKFEIKQALASFLDNEKPCTIPITFWLKQSQIPDVIAQGA
jgi:hypothetical protein